MQACADKTNSRKGCEPKRKSRHACRVWCNKGICIRMGGLEKLTLSTITDNDNTIGDNR